MGCDGLPQKPHVHLHPIRRKGYSLPNSDVGMHLFVTSNQPSLRSLLYVMDTKAEVAKRYESGLPGMQIREEFAQNENPVEVFSEQYSQGAVV